MFSYPKLTVITTVYNCEKFIKESLCSILDQTYTNFQWIILNDGSTDSTWKIVNDTVGKDDRVCLIDSKENKNIPIRRNQVINLAKGEYIAIHDGDDISFPERLRYQVGYLDSFKNVFCLGGHAICIDENGEQIDIMDYPPLSHDQIVLNFLKLKQNPMIDPTTMFRKSDFKNLGGYSLNKNIYTVPDMDLWARAILSGKEMANMSEIFIKYRKNPNGMTLKHKDEMLDANMQVWRKFQRKYNNNCSCQGIKL